MKNYIFCAYNIDSGCVEVKLSNGEMMFIDCTAVEDELADNMHQRSKLDYLIYNAPVDYVNLILSGDVENYLKTVIEYTALE